MLRTSTLTAIAIAALVTAVALFIARHGDDRRETTDVAQPVPVQVFVNQPVRNRASQATVTPVVEPPKSGDPVPALPPNVR